MPELKGIIIIDKPPSLTSHDVVQRTRKYLKIKKVGHTGILDPFATGVLPLCIGQATRLSRFLTPSDKEYVGTIKLGITTDTMDPTGKIIDEKPVPDITESKIEEIFNAFKGEIEQRIPPFSAAKRGGHTMYKLARTGEKADAGTKRVTIKELELLGFEPPLIRFRMVCSAGTYVRVFADDVGKEVGCGAHLFELKRTRCGTFGIDQAMSLDELKEAAKNGTIAEKMISMKDALSFMPLIKVDDRVARKIKNGHAPSWTELGLNPVSIGRIGEHVRMIDDDGELIAVGSIFIEKVRLVAVFT